MRRRRRGAGARQSGSSARRGARATEREVSPADSFLQAEDSNTIPVRAGPSKDRVANIANRQLKYRKRTFKPAELSTLYLNRLLTFSPRYCSARAPPAVRIPLRLCVALARSTIRPSARRVARPSAAAAACSCGARRHSRSAASASAGGRCSPCRSAQAGGVCGGLEGVGKGGCGRGCGRGCRRGCGPGCRRMQKAPRAAHSATH